MLAAAPAIVPWPWMLLYFSEGATRLNSIRNEERGEEGRYAWFLIDSTGHYFDRIEAHERTINNRFLDTRSWCRLMKKGSSIFFPFENTRWRYVFSLPAKLSLLESCLNFWKNGKKTKLVRVRSNCFFSASSRLPIPDWRIWRSQGPPLPRDWFPAEPISTIARS